MMCQAMPSPAPCLKNEGRAEFEEIRHEVSRQFGVGRLSSLAT
jgi:hypothetical protein